MKRDREKEGSGLVTNWEWRLRGNVECSAKNDIAFGASETKGGNKIFEGMGVACTRFFREKKKKKETSRVLERIRISRTYFYVITWNLGGKKKLWNQNQFLFREEILNNFIFMSRNGYFKQLKIIVNVKFFFSSLNNLTNELFCYK